MQIDVLQTGLTYGPIGVALLLLLFGHRIIPRMISRAKKDVSDPKTERLYDWLHMSVWSVVVLMLLVGTGGWIYTLVESKQVHQDNQTELIVRGAFTKVDQTVEVDTEHGHLFSRVSRIGPQGRKDVHWVYNNMVSDEVPKMIKFMFIGEKKINGKKSEFAVYCKVKREEAGLNSSYHREMQFNLQTALISIPTMNDRLIRCTTKDVHLYSSSPVVDFPNGRSTALRLIGQARAEEIENVSDNQLLDFRAARQSLSSADARVRHSARRFLRDHHWQKPEVLNELVLKKGGSYWERLGAMWAISRADPLPRNDMFMSDRHLDMVWLEMLNAAIDEDDAISEAGWRFIMGHPSEKTRQRLEGLRSKISGVRAKKRYMAVLADFHYYRGVSILVAEQLDWEGPGATEAIKEMIKARDILVTLTNRYAYQVGKQEIAKTIYGEGWALAEAAERNFNKPKMGKRAKIDIKKKAKSRLREFLSLDAVKSKLYRYSWQKEHSKRYLETGSVKAFGLE